MQNQRTHVRSLFLGAVGAFTAFVALGLGPAPDEGEIGRYQVSVGGGDSSTTIVLDTVTGETWSRSFDRNVGRTHLRTYVAGPRQGNK